MKCSCVLCCAGKQRYWFTDVPLRRKKIMPTYCIIKNNSKVAQNNNKICHTVTFQAYSNCIWIKHPSVHTYLPDTIFSVPSIIQQMVTLQARMMLSPKTKHTKLDARTVFSFHSYDDDTVPSLHVLRQQSFSPYPSGSEETGICQSSSVVIQTLLKLLGLFAIHTRIWCTPLLLCEWWCRVYMNMRTQKYTAEVQTV